VVDADAIRTKFPQFSGLSDPDIAPALAEALEVVDESSWPASKYDLGVLYMTAHLLAEVYGDEGGAAGPVSSKTEGRVSVSFAVSASTAPQGPNSSTSYGRRYDWYVDHYVGQHILVV